MRIVVVVVALSLGALTGCSGSNRQEDELSSATVTETVTATATATAEGPAPCDLLSVDEAAELADESLEAPEEADVGGMTACKWRAGEVWIQAIAVPADTWAQQLPALVDQLVASGAFDEGENLRKLEEGRNLILSGEDLNAAQACDMFSTMLEIQGQAPGGRRITTIVPTRDDPQAISAQSCERGTYASVLLVRPDLTGSAAEQLRVERALSLVTSPE